jgi:hypothetical protein
MWLCCVMMWPMMKTKKMVSAQWLLTLCLVVFSFSPLSAQQSATTTAPDTRNPQPTQSDIIDSEAPLQEPSSQEVLREPGTIRFEGRDAVALDEESTPSLLISWLIVFGCLAILALAIKIISSKPTSSTNKKTSKISSSSKKGASFKQSYNEPIAPGTKKSLKSSNKKKKRRSKNKSRK